MNRPLRGMTIAVIGAGTMGQALIRGLLASGVPRRALRAADPSAKIRRAVAAQYRVGTTSGAREVIRGADVVLLAVKPQQIAQVIAEMAPRLRRRQLVISIAAGVTLRWLRARLPRIPVVRVMPNLPATVGCGFSAIAKGPGATARHRAIATALFGAVGAVVELPERSFDAITAVSGSGPAYVFYVVALWEEAARRLGLPPQIAQTAVRQTLEGSARLLAVDRLGPDRLVAKVASKRGTTEAALRVLARHRVRQHFIDALRAAARRSKALAWS